jgi:hypothetical protein
MDLPYDIWEAIAAHIPLCQLRQLYGVNHALYNIAMSARYHTLEFSEFDDAKMALLEHLRCVFR